MNATIDTYVLKHAVKKGLGLILWGGLLSSSLAFSNPDLSAVNDVFGGNQYLFRNDDLAYFGVDCPGQCLAEWKIFTTANSAIVGEPFARWDADSDKEIRSPWKVSDRAPSGYMSALAAGRMFNLSNDVVAGIAPRARSNARPEELDLFLMDPIKGPQTALIERVPLENGWSEVDFAWMADFNYDGFDELVMHTAFGDTYLATAKDVNDMKTGLKWIKLGRLDSNKHSWPHAFAVFETQGQNGRRSRVIAMIEPAAEKKDMLRITYQNIAPTSLQSKIVVTDWLSLARKEDQVTSLSAAVGRYGRTDADQLAVAYVTGSGDARVIAYDIKLDSYNAFIRGGENYLGKEAGISVILKSGRLNGRAEYDQAMAWVGTLGQTVARYSSLRLLTFDGNLNIRESANLGLAAQCFSDFALGRFDRRRPAQPEEQDLNLQVALAWRPRCGTDVAGLQVGIVSIDPNQQYKMTLNSQYDEPHVVDSYSGKLVAGDFQGRSLRLGVPTKLTNSQSEVQIALQSPPMHVDWVTPASGGNPTVVNLSAAPSDYFTKFRAESSKTVSAASKSSFGVTWSIYAKGSLYLGGGIDKDNTMGATLKTSMKEKLDNLEDWNTGRLDKQSIDVTSQTGFSDLVLYTERRRNVYVYPVLGRSACPASKPDCGEGEKGPVFVHFVADDRVNRRLLASNNLEWFQPVTEPGNVFSYPYDYEQLQQLYPDIDPLTATSPVAFATDDIAVEQNFRWDRGENRDHTVSTGNSFSGDWSVGMKGKTYKTVVHAEGEFDVGFSYDGASKSANTDSTTLSQSAGIGIKKPGLFADPNLYRYDVQPYVLGRKRDRNWPDFGTPNGEIQTAGPLQVAFSVDVAQGGAWWQREAYALPDVALNHPSRWRIVDKADGSLACLGKSCAVFNDAKPSDVWLSPFHWMRGFYVTPAANSDTSSQMSQLTEGEAVRLHARVYNYSLANMPAGSEVKVRFYGQLWNIATNTPSGQSFLIDEKAYSPIPGFGRSPSNEFNWIMAETQFDPSPYANKDIVFWVLVWMEDGFGQKVGEVTDHGLSGAAAPGALSSIQDVPIENHSNNVGLYKHAFHVFQIPPPKGTPSQPGGQKPRDKTRVLKFRVTPRHNVVEGETVTVELVLKNLDVPVPQMTAVQFYDYNPGNKGPEEADSPFDIDQISHLPANERISVAVPYTPSRCGKTVLYATVPDRNIRAKTSFNVLCR
ncbi:hypothetical protein [Methylococcus mesophilus]|uniref:hypothetical protein n=1 Tax=Methylococcus mesophilus TaxID=2993564 RepID=UPI00224B465C|nr:hypothetical protein [Methylococcus mesophilus]UZR29747.1 hypothetical protein OOT43_03675 [Methylococcus mesophilus]